MQLDDITIILGVLGGGGIIGIFAALFRGITYISTNVVAPVKQSVGQLEEVTRELRSWMEELRRESRDQDKRLAVVEKSLDTMASRLDDLEREVKHER